MISRAYLGWSLKHVALHYLFISISFYLFIAILWPKMSCVNKALLWATWDEENSRREDVWASGCVQSRWSWWTSSFHLEPEIERLKSYEILINHTTIFLLHTIFSVFRAYVNTLNIFAHNIAIIRFCDKKIILRHPFLLAKVSSISCAKMSSM